MPFYFRFYLLGPEGEIPRAILIRLGRSRDDFTSYGFSPFKPRFVKWRHRRWTEAMERDLAWMDEI